MTLQSLSPDTYPVFWVLYTICLLLLVGSARFLFKFVTIRRGMIQLQKQGLPMPPYNFFLGHLPVMARVASSLPADVHPHCYGFYLQRTMPSRPPVFYVDLWPMGPPTLYICDSTSAASQAVQDRSLPKHPGVAKFVAPLAGENNMLILEGSEWKTWRAVFNPGFSSSHLMTLVPGMVEDALVFCNRLQIYAEKEEVFPMEDVATRLTIDIIGRAVLDTPLQAQTSEHRLVSAFRNQVRWIPRFGQSNPLTRFNIFRSLIFWYYARQMSRFVSDELEIRFASHQQGGCFNSGQAKASKRSKSVIDLALDTYNLKENKQASTGLDPTFKRFAINQIRIFLFAGHDTTSSTLCYAYHLLSKHPDALRNIRAEHDEVFGKDTTQTQSILRHDPRVLNKLSYTLAVIKEVLRLYPPASSVRTGQPGYSIDHGGMHYPTDGFMVWTVSHAMHRSPTLWPHPDKFLPDRFIVPENDPLHPPKGAWRPFEYGPRSCIGQELALIESKVILALTARSFDFEACYDEFDAGKDDGKIKVVEGERMYQVLLGSAKPANQMPCRVKVRNVGDF